MNPKPAPGNSHTGGWMIVIGSSRGQFGQFADAQNISATQTLRIGSRATKLYATHSSPTNCDSIVIRNFNLGQGYAKCFFLPEF